MKKFQENTFKIWKQSGFRLKLTMIRKDKIFFKYEILIFVLALGSVCINIFLANFVSEIEKRQYLMDRSNKISLVGGPVKLPRQTFINESSF